MLDLAGPELRPEEREMLLHPLVGGVILFTRNYHSPEQLAELTKQVRGLRDPRLLVGVDHEGGKVQRFREGFTRLPACAAIGAEYDKHPQRGLMLAADYGWVMALELATVGVDFSFAPVLDLGLGVSRVIQDRAYHSDPLIIARLANESVRAMRKGGMAAVGKHFPGHGSVVEDSHYEVPTDSRELAMIEQSDLLPFKHLIQAGLSAIMPAHVLYPKIDEKPAGFSPFWLSTLLRGRLGFDGVVFSDDICMAGAAIAGDHIARVQAALQAGCDVVLVCNDREAAARVLHSLDCAGGSQSRLTRMYAQGTADWRELRRDTLWRKASARLEACAKMWETPALS